MTVENVLGFFDSFKSNEIPDFVKIGWLAEIDGRILCEIHKMDKNTVMLPKGSSDALVLPEGYARVYQLYLGAMTELAQGNFDAYKSFRDEFESALATYAKYYIRNRV